MGLRRRFARACSSYSRRLRVEPLEERRVLAALTVTTNLDVVDLADGELSLREAIFVANTVDGPDTIEFDFGHDGPETIVLTGGELAITDSLTISGAGADLLTIDALGSDLTPDQDNGDGSRVFNIDDGNSATLIDVTIQRLTITGGDVTGSGGALLNVESVSVLDVVLQANAATASGGAIRHEGGSLVVMGSEILANHSASTGVSGGGGGLSIAGGTGVEIIDSTVAENSSRTGGGMDIFGGSGSVSIFNSHVDRNSTTGGGAGGIWRNGNTTLNVVDSTVDDNTATGRGGGLEILGNGAFLLEDSSVSGNRANGLSFGIGGGGGAFFNAAPGGLDSLVIRGSRIADNHAVFDGGGIHGWQSSQLVIEDSEIAGNTAERAGGGIYLYRTGLELRHSIVEENDAPTGTIGLGGGIHGAAGSQVQMRQTLVRGNTATGGGGGIFIVSGTSTAQDASTLLMQDSMVTGNSTTGDGGGIRLVGGTHGLVNSTIANNSATTYGGGIVSSGSTASVEMFQVTISGNQATHSGGGFARTGGSARVSRSTIAGNVADSDGSGHGVGGGIYDVSGSVMSIEQTILGDNRHFNTDDDFYKSFASQLRYSLVERFSSSTGAGGIGNSVGVDPKLAPLADNGGPIFLDGSRMLTYALLAGSPAIDAGDPTGGTPAFGAVYRAEVLEDLPRYYYRFEEASVSSGVKDETSAQTGAYLGSPTLGVAGAIPGSRAVGFDGVNDYVRANSLTVGPRMTVELWARSATETWNASGWLARSDVTNMFVINPIQGTKSWSAIVYDTNGTAQTVGTFTPEAAIDIRDWHHFALSWDQNSGAATMYFDGVAVAANTIVKATPNSTSVALLTGFNDGTSAPSYGKGAVDELAIYNQVLSADAIAEHFRVASLGEFDQRGEPHARVIDGDGISGPRIDMGAVEAPLGETYTLVVDSLVDEHDGDYTAGNFSLREALAVASVNPGAATIEFAPALTAGGPATILLTQGELVISSSMVINGPGAHLLAIDASRNDPTPDSTLNDGVATNDGDGSRVLSVDDGTGANRNVEIRGLRFTGGDVNSDGGGILARDNLILRESIVEGNISRTQGGGIFSLNASLTIVDSAVSGNATGHEGGGIRKVIGDLTVDRTVVDGNQAGQVGGGISAANEHVEVLIRDSLIQKNRNLGTSTATGGGIFLFDAIATILNTSVVENLAPYGGGIYSIDYTGSTSDGFARTRIFNSTVSGNFGNVGRGIYTQGSTEISHSTIIDNNVQGAVETIYSTIIAGVGISSSNTGNYNIVNSSTAGLVGPLFGSGEHVFIDGSRLLTHALLAGSPAIDAGNPADVAGVGSVPEFDQRGATYGRVVNGDAVGSARIDIGAYERRADEVLSFVVDTLEDDDGDDFSPGDRSLREVIELANAVAGVQTITFHPDLLAAGAGEILLKFGEIPITEALNIDGPGAELLTVNAQQLSRVFNITATAGNFVIEGLTLANGKTTGVSNLTGPTPHVGSGGAIRSMTAGTLTINDAAIRDSSTTGTNSRGGGVFAVGPVTLDRSIVSGNSTAGNGAYGGGLAVQGTMTVTDSTVHGNRVLAVDELGGGFWSVGNTTITRSMISGNELAAGSPFYGGLPPTSGGGGLAVQTGFILLTDSVVRDNVTHGWAAAGGGIRALNGPIVITRSLIVDNQAGGSGGGAYGRRDVEVIDSTVSSNSAFGRGGGVYSEEDAIVSNSTISGNSTMGVDARAGGVGGNTVIVQWSTITNNHTSGILAHGGGAAAASLTSLRGSIVAGNTAGSGQGDDLWGAGNLFSSLLGNNVGATGTYVAEAPVDSPDARGNLIGGSVNGVIDPLLGPLTNNGGSTLPDGSRILTHALLSGSPAIDAGDPAALAGVNGVPEFDQRGTGFGRMVDGDGAGGARIDMGAYERAFGEIYTFVVDTVADESDGDYSLGDFSLREAIELANANAGKDIIEFNPSLWAAGPATILLTMVGDDSPYGRSALAVFDSIEIQGPGAGLLTIDASGIDPTPDEDNGDGGRVLLVVPNFYEEQHEMEISGLTIRGGDMGFGNSTAVNGGGIYAKSVRLVLRNSVVTGNHSQLSGGGVYVHVDHANAETLIERTVITNNRASSGGGMELAQGSTHGIVVRDSLIANNVAESTGGGLVARTFYIANVPILLESSTVSGNTALFAGGMYAGSDASMVWVRRSTITNNIATSSAGAGGLLAYGGELLLSDSIVAGNRFWDGTASDLGGNTASIFGPAGTFGVTHSLIGTNAGTSLIETQDGAPDANGNLIGGPVIGVINPLLGPLVNNGGPTKTHALLPGSPAIDAGDPTAVAGVNGVPEFDQRGGPWGRVANGDDVPEARIDMGAVEAQANPLTGDSNFNGVVDAADYSVWMDTVGSMSDLRADGDGDGSVDADDYDIWKAHFGETLEQGAGSRPAAQVPRQGEILKEQGGGGAVAASQRLAGESGEETLSVLAMLEESMRNTSSRRAVRSRLFENAVAGENGDLLIASLARRAKCVEEIAELELDREEEAVGAAVDEVFARVGARRWRLS